MVTYKLLAKLVDSQMDGAEGASTNLLLYQILVYAMFCSAVVTAVAVFGAGIERFLLRRM